MNKYPICSECLDEINPEMYQDSDYLFTDGKKTICPTCFVEQVEGLLKTRLGRIELADALGYQYETVTDERDCVDVYYKDEEV